MSALYKQVGISRQAHFQSMKRKQKRRVLQEELIKQVRSVRQIHPRMGLRKLYYLLKPEGVGRDQFERLMADSGLKLKKKPNYVRTTYPERFHKYTNLISGMEIKDKNQVWVSDITYYRGRSRYFYLTFILDVYTRKIVGWSTSNQLTHHANLEALAKAINQSTTSLKGLIHHSDRGTQYLSSSYTKLLESKGIQISIGNKAWENAHAERINGIIKGEYLSKKSILGLRGLQKQVDKSVHLYNSQRPHWNLPGIISPVSFERIIDKSKFDYKVKINY